MLNSLTEYELKGLESYHNLADGHAYHSLSESFSPIVEKISNIWNFTNNTPVIEAERKFKFNFSELIDSQALNSLTNFRISPTASNSIDIIAAFLKINFPRVLLIEPTFDNLAQLLRRRGCDLIPLHEDKLLSLESYEELTELLDEFDFDCVFLVNPNNPTGNVLNKDLFCNLLEYCESRSKFVTVDTTFRLFGKEVFDEYKYLQQFKVDFCVIEDTGKTWPTHDMKASMMCFSDGYRNQINEIYDEIYLCHSRFTMGLFCEIFEYTNKVSIKKAIHDPILARKKLVKNCMKTLPFEIQTNNTDSILPLEWLSYDKNLGVTNGLELADTLSKDNLMVLPGEYFYWNKRRSNDINVRISLSRPLKVLSNSLNLLSEIYSTQSLGYI